MVVVVAIAVLCSPLVGLHWPLGEDRSGSAHASDGTKKTLDVVALGDSVPAGADCDCDPFPVDYGRLLEKRTHDHVHVDDDGINGLDTSGLRADLDDNHNSMASQVAAADIVLLTIGANDFTDHHDDVTAGTCVTTDHDCVSDELATMRTGVARIISTIRRLRAGARTTILVTGYWNVFEDGDVARNAYGDSGLRSSIALTKRANTAIAAAAAATGATYVDVFTPFQDAGTKITALLAGDGDHPSAIGHELIARTLVAVGRPTAGTS